MEAALALAAVKADYTRAVAAPSTTDKELRMTDEQRKFLFDRAHACASNKVVIADMKEKFNVDVAPSTVAKYRKLPELVIGDVGRPQQLGAACETNLVNAFRGLRDAGVALVASAVAACATGICERQTKGSTVLGGGSLTFSTSWARKWMKAHNMAVRKGTTDRVITAKAIVDGGTDFFATLDAFKTEHPTLRPGNVYNMDEFFVLMSNENSNWTWAEIKGASESVPIKQHQVGFTCGVTTAADGATVLTQFIYRGTERVFVTGPSLDNNDAVLQCARAGTHFQDSETFKSWCTRFELIANSRRASADEPVLLLVDSATQHGECETFFAGKNIHIIRFPPRMTHVFQPADQFIIAYLKQRAKDMYSAWVSGLFAREGVSEAVSQATTTSVPEVRKRKVGFIAEAAAAASTAVVTSSWARTGITRQLFGLVTSVVLFDLYKAAFLAASDDLEKLEVNECDEPDEVREAHAAAAEEAAEDLPAVEAPVAAAVNPKDAVTPPASKRGRPSMTPAEKDAAKQARQKEKRIEAAKGTPKLETLFAKKGPKEAKKESDAPAAAAE